MMLSLKIYDILADHENRVLNKNGQETHLARVKTVAEIRTLLGEYYRDLYDSPDVKIRVEHVCGCYDYIEALDRRLPKCPGCIAEGR